MTPPLYGAIDCGTNSTRLLISDGGEPLERLMTITRLGRGVDSSRRLAPEAIEATLAVLRDYATALDTHRVANVRLTATSAVRDSVNREDFFGPVRDLLGVEPELLSGQQEAELSFLGATASLPVDAGPYLVVDIGGGSTEFAFGSARVEASASVQMGCVRLTEKYLRHDPPLPEELSNCLSEVEFLLDSVVAEHPLIGSTAQFVGLAGTVTSVAAIELGLIDYDPLRVHHFKLTKAAAEDVFRTLATEALADRVHNPGLEASRADVIVGGCCVLVAVMRRFGLHECLVSEADILDGLVRSQIPPTASRAN